MIQQINLYQAGLSDEDALAERYGVGAVIVLGVLLLLSLVLGISWYRTQYQLEEMTKQLELVKSGISQEQASHPEPARDERLEQDLMQAQSMYQNLVLAVESLSDANSDASLGFSRYLLALANQADGQVWITRITIDSQAKSMALEGSSYKPDRIPLMLERLQAADAFKGRQFARLSLQESDNNNQVDFTVSSHLEADGAHEQNR